MELPEHLTDLVRSLEDTDTFVITSSHYFGKPKQGIIHIVHRVSNQTLCNRNVKITVVVRDFLINNDNLCKVCKRLYHELFNKENNFVSLDSDKEYVEIRDELNKDSYESDKENPYER